MPRTNHSTQRGAVLIIALLFLTILTILGVTAMTATTFEERMAGNTRDVGVAFQAAEAGLRDARRDINSIVIPPFAAPRNPTISGKTGFGDGTDTKNETCGTSQIVAPQTLGLCMPWDYDGGTGVQPRFNTVGLQNDKSVPYGTYTGAPALVGLSAQPRYYIEVLCLQSGVGSIGGGTGDNCNFYRITSRGFGVNPNTRVTVQEIFLKP